MYAWTAMQLRMVLFLNFSISRCVCCGLPVLLSLLPITLRYYCNYLNIFFKWIIFLRSALSDVYISSRLCFIGPILTEFQEAHSSEPALSQAGSSSLERSPKQPNFYKVCVKHSLVVHCTNSKVWEQFPNLIAFTKLLFMRTNKTQTNQHHSCWFNLFNQLKNWL